MRLRADQPEARNVQAVLLDGKAVPMCHEASEEEGWVTSYVPDLPGNPPANGETLVENDDAAYAGMKLVKREGKVQIRFRQDATTVDDQQAPEGA